jgi:hypothetical protein
MNDSVSSTEASWLLHFTYQHSTHNVVISLTADSILPFDTDIGNLLIVGIIAAVIVAVCV